MSRGVRAIAPADAWKAVKAGEAQLLDLRTESERKRYGWPPGAPRVSLVRHVAWPRARIRSTSASTPIARSSLVAAELPRSRAAGPPGRRPGCLSRGRKRRRRDRHAEARCGSATSTSSASYSPFARDRSVAASDASVPARERLQTRSGAPAAVICAAGTVLAPSIRRCTCATLRCRAFAARESWLGLGGGPVSAAAMRARLSLVPRPICFR